jgi:signal transduction histidine kinase
MNKDIFEKKVKVNKEKMQGNQSLITEKTISYGKSSKAEVILKKISHDLGERIKELSCLYKISNILNNSSLLTEDTFSKIIEVIIPSYQYPEITAAKLTLGDDEYKTDNFKSTPWKQTSPLLIKKKSIGKLEVVYLKKRPDIYEGPFLKEERHLINSITQLIVQYIIRKKAESELTESREQLKNFAAHLQTIREEERTYISRELHDNLGQSLTAMRIDLHNIITDLSEKNESNVLENIIKQSHNLISIIDSTIQTVRNIARELRPSILDNLGLLAAIEWQIREFSKRSGMKCRLVTSLNKIDIETKHSIGVFRIVQESLTNVLRHSKATEVTIKIFEKEANTVIEIKDNGCGINESEINSTKSLGLLGMRERALIFGGELLVKGEKAVGTKIFLKIPIIKQNK